MADEPKVTDNLPAPPPDASAPPAGGGGNGDGDEFQLGNHKFKTREAAGESYEEIVAAHNKKSEALNAAQKELENLRQQAQLTGAIEKLAEASKKPDKNEISFDEFMSQVETKAQEDPAEAIRMAVEVQERWRQQDRTMIHSEFQKEREALEEEIRSLKMGQERLAPDYLSHKDDVDRLVAKGMKSADAIEFAKELAAARASNDRELPPGNNNGPNRAAHQQQTTDIKYFKDENEWIAFAGDAGIDPYSDDGKRQRAQIEADYIRNYTKGIDDLKELTG